METKEFLKKSGKVAIATLRWLGFILFEAILTGLNLLVIYSIFYYCNYVFGDTPHIKPEYQTVSIKKVDGFYLIQDGDYNGYVERTFPDCSIKFYGRILTFKDGDIYDKRTKVTDKVEIQGTRMGFRVYYLNKSYPLKTLTKFDGSYEDGYHRVRELKDMYANNGWFYTDVDSRAWFANLILLGVVLCVIFFVRYGVLLLTRRLFDEENHKTFKFLGDNVLGLLMAIVALPFVLLGSLWKKFRKNRKKKIKKSLD